MGYKIILPENPTSEFRRNKLAKNVVWCGVVVEVGGTRREEERGACVWGVRRCGLWGAYLMTIPYYTKNVLESIETASTGRRRLDDEFSSRRFAHRCTFGAPPGRHMIIVPFIWSVTLNPVVRLKKASSG